MSRVISRRSFNTPGADRIRASVDLVLPDAATPEKTSLQEMATNDTWDGSVILVKLNSSFWWYSATSTETESSTCIAPAHTGNGRWYMISQGVTTATPSGDWADKWVDATRIFSDEVVTCGGSENPWRREIGRDSIIVDGVLDVLDGVVNATLVADATPEMSRTVFIPADKITPLHLDTGAAGGADTLTAFGGTGGLHRLISLPGARHVLCHEAPTGLVTIDPKGMLPSFTSSPMKKIKSPRPDRLVRVRCLYHNSHDLYVSGPPAEWGMVELTISTREMLIESGDLISSAPLFEDTVVYTTSDCPSDPRGDGTITITPLGNLNVGPLHDTAEKRAQEGYHSVDFELDPPLSLTSDKLPLIRVWIKAPTSMSISFTSLYFGTVLFIETAPQ
tara:strand:+ start:275 stop:1447 length:1173 start_codon:yes stop_codon:yes gene_type:complete